MQILIQQCLIGRGILIHLCLISLGSPKHLGLIDQDNLARQGLKILESLIHQDRLAHGTDMVAPDMRVHISLIVQSNQVNRREIVLIQTTNVYVSFLEILISMDE